ncbi:MAG: IPT/TIG domain-containing protein [Anaerolineae bacterium]|nr:IPT/TIG domain-containing protein [Anaerolineae bacterium]
MKQRLCAVELPVWMTLWGVLLCTLVAMGLVVASPMLTSAAQAAPAVAQVDPMSAPNDVDTPVTITGSAFVPTPTVYLGTTPLIDVRWVSDSVLEATVPWGMAVGVYPLTVENPDGQRGSLSSAFTVTQGLGAWTTDGPYGGSVHHLAMDELVTTTLYAAVGLAGADGLFKSEDGGAHWSNAFSGTIATRTPLAGFALKPGAPGTIYLSGRTADGDRLVRSTDGGGHWDVIWAGGTDFYALGVSPGDPESLYAASGAAIVRSTDGGDTWQPADGGIPAGASISVLAVHPVTPTIAYAGLEPGRVYRTLDGGASWAQVADLGDGWWSFLAVDPHAPERIYASGWHTAYFFARSLDGGDTWAAMTLEPGSDSANDIAFHPTVSGTIYVIAPGVYRSTDAGATWQKAPVPDTASEGWSLLLHPQSGLPLYIGHNGKGVLYSDNGGADWVRRSDGLAGLRPHEIAACPADVNYIYVAADEGGGFASHDGGESWLAAEGDRLDRGISVAAHPYTPTVAYLGARRAVFKTADGGLTWTRHELPGLPDDNEMRVHAIAIDPNDPQVIYAGPGTWDFAGGPEQGWLYRSLDAGETWSPLSTTFPISPVTDIEIDPTDSQTIYVSTGRRFLDSTDRGSGILKTEDGGVSWVFVTGDLAVRSFSRLAINPDLPATVYAGTVLESDSAESGVYRTLDGGGQWGQLTGGVRVSGLGIDPLMTGTLFLGTYLNGLFTSIDAGAHWERVAGLPPQLSIESLHVTTAPDRTIVLVGVAGDLILGDGQVVAGRAPAAPIQFYNGGVYRITIDRRFPAHRVYLPLAVKN